MHPFLRHLNYCLQFILPVCFPLSPFSRFSLSTRLSSSLTSISLLLLFRCLGVSPGTSPLPPVSGCAPPRTLVSSFPRAVGSLCSPSRRRLPLSSPPSPPPRAPPAPRSPPNILPVTRGPPDKSLQGQPNFEGQDKASAYGPIPRCLSFFLLRSPTSPFSGYVGNPARGSLLRAPRAAPPPPSSAPSEK